MEPYPLHYTHRPKSDDPVDPNFRMLLDEMQRMETRLSEKIEGCCSGLEKHVGDLEHHSEECFISLEMVHTEAKVERINMDKQFTGLKLKVGHLNRLLERKNLVNSQSKPGIISTIESVDLFTDGPDGHHANNHHRDREIGLNFAPFHIPVNGMNPTKSLPRGAEIPQELGRASHFAAPIESMRASQGRLPKI
jgi:hypothetical protein